MQAISIKVLCSEHRIGICTLFSLICLNPFLKRSVEGGYWSGNVKGWREIRRGEQRSGYQPHSGGSSRPTAIRNLSLFEMLSHTIILNHIHVKHHILNSIQTVSIQVTQNGVSLHCKVFLESSLSRSF